MGAIVAAVLAASAIASLATPGAAGASVPDAYCDGPTDNVAALGGTAARFAQTFSPINGGYLTAVRLFVDEVGHGGDYLVQITPVSGSNVAPTDPLVVLAQATIADSSIPTNGVNQSTQVEADFPNPPAVLASSEYAIVLKRPGDPNGIGIGTKSTPHPDPCAFGGLYHSNDDSSPWIGPLSSDDAVFSTFMTGSTVPPPTAATGKRAAALAKCKKKHSHKAKKKCKKKANLLPV
jgi:hypothetical protein